jgi:nitrate/nitrite transporter NarK
MTSFRRAVLILVVWGAATAFGLAFAAWTAVGPVLLTLTHRHGVHVGDLVAFVAAYSAAAALTRRFVRWPSVRSSR